MNKNANEPFYALIVRLGKNDVECCPADSHSGIELRFTTTGLKKLRSAENKRMAEILREKHAREKAEQEADYQRLITKKRDELADEEFGRYNFEGLVVADSDGWETTTGSNDWQKNVYVKNKEDPRADSVRLSFYVIFEDKKDSLRIKDVYCLDFKSGIEVGRRVQKRKLRYL